MLTRHRTRAAAVVAAALLLAILIVVVVSSDRSSKDSSPQARNSPGSQKASAAVVDVQLTIVVRSPHVDRPTQHTVSCRSADRTARCALARRLRDLPPIPCASASQRQTTANITGTIAGRRVAAKYTNQICPETLQRWTEVQPLWGTSATSTTNVMVFATPPPSEVIDFKEPTDMKGGVTDDNAPDLEVSASDMVVRPCTESMRKTPYRVCTIEESSGNVTPVAIELPRKDAEALSSASDDDIVRAIRNAKKLTVPAGLNNHQAPPKQQKPKTLAPPAERTGSDPDVQFDGIEDVRLSQHNSQVKDPNPPKQTPLKTPGS